MQWLRHVVWEMKPTKLLVMTTSVFVTKETGPGNVEALRSGRIHCCEGCFISCCCWKHQHFYQPAASWRLGLWSFHKKSRFFFSRKKSRKAWLNNLDTGCDIIKHAKESAHCVQCGAVAFVAQRLSSLNKKLKSLHHQNDCPKTPPPLKQCLQSWFSWCGKMLHGSWIT